MGRGCRGTCERLRGARPHPRSSRASPTRCRPDIGPPRLASPCRNTRRSQTRRHHISRKLAVLFRGYIRAAVFRKEHGVQQCTSNRKWQLSYVMPGHDDNKGVHISENKVSRPRRTSYTSREKTVAHCFASSCSKAAYCCAASTDPRSSILLSRQNRPHQTRHGTSRIQAKQTHYTRTASEPRAPTQTDEMNHAPPLPALAVLVLPLVVRSNQRPLDLGTGPRRQGVQVRELHEGERSTSGRLLREDERARARRKSRTKRGTRVNQRCTRGITSPNRCAAV